MVRDSLILTRRSGRAVTAGLLAALLLNLGCLGTETRSWFSSKPEVPPPANDMAVMYYKQVRYIPDPTKGGTPSAALTLRMYLFKGEKFGEPIIGEGTIIVDVYDDNKPAGRDGSVPVETTKFPKELLPKMLQKDVLGGQGGYTLMIPCPPDVTQVHLAVRFEQTGHTPLFKSSDSMTLDRGTPPRPTQPTAGVAGN